MCWTTFKPFKKVRAKKDLIVYKILTSDLVTPIYNMKLTPNKKYFEPRFRISNEIEYGFNSFSVTCDIILYLNNIVTFGKDGLYSSSQLPLNGKLYKCIIPKNSVYVENEIGQIISNSIIVTNNFIPVSELCLSDYIPTMINPSKLKFQTM